MKTEEKITTDHIIDTPYIGYSSVSGLDYFKTATSCGICAVGMILSLQKIPVNINSLIENGHNNGGFTPLGWLHSYLVGLLQENGLNYARLENCPIEQSLQQIKEGILDGGPVIVSVNKLCLEQISFHIVLIVGIKINPDKSIAGFFYHDPAASTKENGSLHFVSVENFIKFWRKMMITKI
ncbi:MAG: C39 family peptidase [Candidatus Paceibacterota bacterium]